MITVARRPRDGPQGKVLAVAQCFEGGHAIGCAGMPIKIDDNKASAAELYCGQSMRKLRPPRRDLRSVSCGHSLMAGPLVELLSLLVPGHEGGKHVDAVGRELERERKIGVAASWAGSRIEAADAGDEVRAANISDEGMRSPAQERPTDIADQSSSVNRMRRPEDCRPSARFRLFWHRARAAAAASKLPKRSPKSTVRRVPKARRRPSLIRLIRYRVFASTRRSERASICQAQ
jgi:hypothetical protein